MMRNRIVLLLILVVLSGGFSSASATPPPASEYGKLIHFSHFLFHFSFVLLTCSASNPYLLSTLLLFFFFTNFAEIISGVVSNVVSALVKWLWSLKPTTKTGIDLSVPFPVLSPIFEVVYVEIRLLSEMLKLMYFMGSIFSSIF